MKKHISRARHALLLILCLLGLTACASKTTTPEQPRPATQVGETAPTGDANSQAPSPQAGIPPAVDKSGSAQKSIKAAPVAECWKPLLQRLENDKLADAATRRYFSATSEYSQTPMGTKVTELFKNSFMRQPAPPRAPDAPPPSRVYKSVITEANAQKCIQFLQTHKRAFDGAEAKYKVPREVIVSLMYVETRLGEYVGKQNAFWSLACMASATTPEHVSETLEKLPYSEEAHGKWLQTKLTDKSDWAYKELKALLTHCKKNQLDPGAMPGSVYGAIGLCQFMPSNIAVYGADGDSDGVIDLFSVPDAIYSIASYLTAHGWKENSSDEQRHAVLKRYNNLNIYANTILVMSETVEAGGVFALKAKKEALASAENPKPKTKPAAAKPKPARKSGAKKAA